MRTINVKNLMSVSGKGGLFKFLSQARNGVIVESLKEKKRTIVPPTARISSLEDISIYTEDEDVPLSDVFMKIYEKENGEAAINPKSSNDQFKDYFLEVLDNYDQERVYASDIKKVITWYNTLHNLEALEIVEKEDDEASEETEQDSED